MIVTLAGREGFPWILENNLGQSMAWQRSVEPRETGRLSAGENWSDKFSREAHG
jgi:hypothetical protein